MPRGRSPERDEARKMWLESDGTLLLKEIAAKLGVPEGRVRKWKSEDKWAVEKEQMKKERSRTKKRNVPNQKEAPALNTRKRGGQQGNTNAVGNSGGVGGPEGNSYHLKHGAYCKVLESTMTDEEREIFAETGMMESTEEELDALYKQLCIKELRLLRRINDIRQKAEKTGGMMVTGITLTESDGYYGMFLDRYENLIARGIDPETMTPKEKAIAHHVGGIGRFADDFVTKTKKTDTKLADEHLLKLEAELDKVQRRKLEILRQRAALRHTSHADELADKKFEHSVEKDHWSDQRARDKHMLDVEKYNLDVMKFDGGGKSQVVDDWVSAVIGEPVEKEQEGGDTVDKT